MARASDSNEFFQLPRPQYPPAAEVLISSLIWQLSRDSHKSPQGKGIVFKKTENAKNHANVYETFPLNKREKVDAMVNVFNQHFSVTDLKTKERAVRILVEDMIGSVPPKANAAAVIPFNAPAALMQDVEGMSGVSNPPNYAKIFQRFFTLGGGQSHVAFLVFKALSVKNTNQTTAWLDDFIEAMMPDQLVELSKSLDYENISHNPDEIVTPKWLTEIETPFTWFAKTWKSLTHESWVNAMPRRRWIDWAGCVLRTAMGTGYIFEMNFYFQLAMGLKSHDIEPDDVCKKALSINDSILKWDENASVSSRDVASKIRKLCERGTACRNLLVDWLNDADRNDMPLPSEHFNHVDGLSDWIIKARSWMKEKSSRDLEIGKRLNDAISGQPASSANNVYETIRYSLLDRGNHGEEDLYALLKKRGSRFSVVEPGQEWFVVVSSLIAESPQGRISVRDLVSSLNSLGIDANFKTIIKQIESVGLGRSSHDADDAVEIATAF